MWLEDTAAVTPAPAEELGARTTAAGLVKKPDILVRFDDLAAGVSTTGAALGLAFASVGGVVRFQAPNFLSNPDETWTCAFVAFRVMEDNASFLSPVDSFLTMPCRTHSSLDFASNVPTVFPMTIGAIDASSGPKRPL